MAGSDDELVQGHALGDMVGESLGSRRDLAGQRPAFACQARFFLSQMQAVMTDNDAVEAALVVGLDHFTGMDVLGYEGAVEDGEVRISCRPLLPVKADVACVAQQFDRSIIGNAQRLTA